MSNKSEKPKMSSKDLIYQKCRAKGITFKYIQEDKAVKCIQEKNNFLRMGSYRKNYKKHDPTAGNPDHYINLDFGYLYELSVIDMHLRHLITKMCIDVEHALKVSLIKTIEDESTQNGYSIVADYISNLNNDSRQKLIGGLEGKSKSSYTGDLICKNFTIKTHKHNGRSFNKITAYTDCPAWVFVEVLSFGEFLYFHSYCATQIGFPQIDNKILNQVRSLRNGCAHNNCLIANLIDQSGGAPTIISTAVSKLNISKLQRRKLRNRFISEFTSLLYIYGKVVSDSVKQHRTNELTDFLYGRAIQKKAFFKDNDVLTSSYKFITKIVANFL